MNKPVILSLITTFVAIGILAASFVAFVNHTVSNMEIGMVSD